MLAERNTEVAGMLELDVPEEMLMDRLINRGKTSGRADDNAETIEALGCLPQPDGSPHCMV